MLLCPVRECQMQLVRENRRVVCERGHSFDVARSGYINLLQPQDRRSKQPGDTVAAVAGRRRLHDLGLAEHLLHAVASLMQTSREDTVLDAGCGDGYYLGSLARQVGFSAHGVDISIPAVDAAAKRYPDCDWIVANDVSAETGIMGGAENAVTVITAQGSETWPRLAKTEVARRLAARMAEALNPKTEP